MPSCALNGCKNNATLHKKSQGITFHTFPLERTRKAKWIRFVRKNRNDADWLPSKRSVVCSLHFEECEIYETKRGCSRIKKNAAPKKIHLINSKWYQEMEQTEQKSIYTESSAPALTENYIIKVEVDADDPLKQCSQVELDVDDSELDSLIVTPEELRLSEQVKKYKLRFKRHARQFNTLNQKINRLKKKNESMQNTIKDLKNFINLNLKHLKNEQSIIDQTN